MKNHDELRKIIREACAILSRRLSYAETKLYDLVAVLVEEAVYPWSESQTIALYQKLFITQAALCELYFDLELQGKDRLVLTPISVYLRKQAQSDSSEASQTELASSGDEQLAPNVEFFGDPTHFFDITEAEIDRLIARFWRSFDALDAGDNALQVLGLEEGASWQDIQAQYRLLASEHHPDRGGDAQAFIDIRSAYEKLRYSRY